MTLDDLLLTLKIAYISGATLDSERHWTHLELGTGNIVWAPERLRGYCVGNKIPDILRSQDTGKHWQSGDP